MVSNRELSGLTSTYLNDGARGMEKPSARNTSKAAFTERLRSLFLNEAAPQHPGRDTRRLQAIYQSPNVYLVPHFLTARELDHFDEVSSVEPRCNEPRCSPASISCLL